MAFNRTAFGHVVLQTSMRTRKGDAIKPYTLHSHSLNLSQVSLCGTLVDFTVSAFLVCKPATNLGLGVLGCNSQTVFPVVRVIGTCT